MDVNELWIGKSLREYGNEDQGRSTRGVDYRGLRDQRGKVVLVLIRRPHSRGKIDLDLPTRVMCRSACSEKTFVEDGTYQITRAEHVVLSTGVSIVNRAALAE